VGKPSPTINSKNRKNKKIEKNPEKIQNDRKPRRKNTKLKGNLTEKNRKIRIQIS